MRQLSTSPFVFLSYSKADSSLVERLRTDLDTQGIVTWIDLEGIQPGTPDWEEALRTAIRAAHAVLLIASPNARSSRYVKDELRIAQMYQRPIYPIWIAGEQWMEAIPLGFGGIQYIDARDGRYASALSEIVALLGAPFTTESSTNTFPAIQPGPNIEPRNPYKGLRAFTFADAHDFFGRDALIEELLEALKVAIARDIKGIQSTRLLAVIGPSGSGKSSVIMAGLLPRLQCGGLQGSEKWVYLDPFVPGVHPIESLTLALAEKLHDKSLKTIREDLEDDSARGLHLYATTLAKLQGTKVVLFVDQFEELFTQITSEEERSRFIDVLVTAINEPNGPVIVILTLRADFYDRPMRYPLLHQLIQAHQTSVLPMETHDLREIIEKPAKLSDVQVTFEGDLVGDLLFEVRGQVGALPLLQFTLDQLFQRRKGSQLTLSAYHEIGGVKGALTRQAEETYANLPSNEHRSLARALFVRLIDPGASEQDTTRRRAALSEFSLDDPAKTNLLRETIDAFIAARLLTTNELTGISTIEVSHEALIREWIRLSDWLREAREDIRLQQLISKDIAVWERYSKPRDRLYRGSQLKDAKAWAKRNVPSMQEIAFLHASTLQQNRSRIGLTALLLLLVLAIGLIVRSVLQPKPDPTIVTTLSDNGPGSLRQAIALANPGDTITFDKNLRGIIKLKSGRLYISKSLNIRGSGVNSLSITNSSGDGVQVDTNSSVSIFGLTFKDIGGILNNGILTLTNSAVSDNLTVGTGGINNSGTLTLINSSVSGNKAFGDGGGIANSGTLTLINSSVSGNKAYSDEEGGNGGGIANSGTLTLTNSAVSDNTADSDGGGIANSGTLTLTNSTVSGNTAFTGNGGGIVDSGPLTLTNSTVSGNTANSNGGGIFGSFFSGVFTGTFFRSLDQGNTRFGPFTLTNSTVSGNRVLNGGGGGMAFLGSQANITFCTVYGNSVVNGNGGGILTGNASVPEFDSNGKQVQVIVSSHIQMRNTIVAHNQADGKGQDMFGEFSSQGYNLIQNSSGADIHHSGFGRDLIGLSIVLGSLQKNGGPTQTQALNQDSPAIDQIPLDACHVNSITTDQRGVKRPDGNESACDIGAYESSFEP